MTDYSDMNEYDLNVLIAERRDFKLWRGKKSDGWNNAEWRRVELQDKNGEVVGTMTAEVSYGGDLDEASKDVEKELLARYAPQYAQDMKEAIKLYAELPYPQLFAPEEDYPMWRLGVGRAIETKCGTPSRAIAEAWLMHNDQNKGEKQ